MPSRRHRSLTVTSRRNPSSTIRIFSPGVYLRRVAVFTVRTKDSVSWLRSRAAIACQYADGGRTYLRGPLEETVDWFDCFFCTTYVVGSRLCRLRLPYQVVVQNDWTGVAVEHADLERLFQRKGATCVPRAVGPRSYDPESVHQFRDLKAALVAVGAPLRYPDQRVAVQLHDSRTYLSWRTG